MNIVRLCRLALAGSVVGLLCSGCVATSFDPANAGRIHVIAVAPVEEPIYQIQLRFVLRTDARDFSDMMKAQNLHLGAEMKAAIAQALRGDGYTVVDQGAGSADANLSIVIDGAPPNGAPMYEDALTGFEPEYSVKIVLKDAATGHVLYDRLFLYRDNSLSPLDGTLLIKPDPKYSFASAPTGNPALAAEGFRAPIPIIANAIGIALRKP